VTAVRPRDLITALRGLYPNAAVKTQATGPGAFLVILPASVARYWLHDPARAAAWPGWELRTPVEVTGAETDRTGAEPLVTSARRQPVPAPAAPSPLTPHSARCWVTSRPPARGAP
jgi:hypothetical protein